MVRRWTVLLVTGTALILAAFAAEPGTELLSPQGTALTEPERAQLERGEILVDLAAVSGTAIKRATAVAVVDATPSQVFAVLTDYDSFTQFMPYCRKVKVQKKNDEQTWVRFDLDFPWPIGDRYYVLRMKDKTVDTAKGSVLVNSWTYEPGSGNINDTYGSWEVRPYPGGKSSVRYTVFTDPGGNIPGWVANMASETAMPNVIKGLRKRLQHVAGSREKPSSTPVQKHEESDT